MSSTKPHIFIVPGFWEVPEVFDSVREVLHKNDLETTLAPLGSTGKTNPMDGSSSGQQIHTLESDTLGIRAVLEPLVVSQGLDIIAVLHSAGGFLGSGAMEGLTKKARSEKGLPGGVKKIVFLTAGIISEGQSPGQLPEQFPTADIVANKHANLVVEDGQIVCSNPRKIAFNDITDEAEIQRCMKLLKGAPLFGWDGPVTFCGWKEVPSVYLVCEKDAALSRDVQMAMVKKAGSEIATCDAGHMVQLSQPDTVAKLVIRVASE